MLTQLQKDSADKYALTLMGQARGLLRLASKTNCLTYSGGDYRER
jgi:hypothetical protein